MLNIRHLRHLIAIAEEGTLQKASDRLHITQPALTKSVQALETSLDARLFERVGRSLRLTDLGAELVRSGKRILRSVHDTEQMVKNWNAGETGRITIGLGPAYTVLLSAKLIETAVTNFDTVQLQLETGNTSSLIARLLDDTVDIAVCDLASPTAHEEIVALDLQPQPIVALVRNGHPLLLERRPSMRSLSGFPVGHSPAPAQFADFGANLANTSATHGTTLCLSENYDALASVTETSDLVTLLPNNLAETYRAGGTLNIIEMADIPQPSMPKILYRQGNKNLPPLGHRLIKHIQSIFAPTASGADKRVAHS